MIFFLSFFSNNIFWGDCLSALQAISEPTPENKLVCDILHSIQNQAKIVWAFCYPSCTIEWVEQVKPMHTCILSDCLSALQAISEPTQKKLLVCDIRHILLSKQNQAKMVIFEWVPVL